MKQITIFIAQVFLCIICPGFRFLHGFFDPVRQGAGKYSSLIKFMAGKMNNILFNYPFISAKYPATRLVTQSSLINRGRNNNIITHSC